MPTLRYATPHDAALINTHRHSMFGDNSYASQATLDRTDAAFEPWVRDRLADGRYIGLLLENANQVVAGAGIFLAEFPPHWIDPQPLRAYILNVYTAPAYRGNGYARQLMLEVIRECRSRSIPTLVLHASPLGRHVYEKLGFANTDEMMLRLEL